jgi:hypothetical protein
MKCAYLATTPLDPIRQGHKRWTICWKPILQAFRRRFCRPIPRRPPLTHTTRVKPLPGQIPRYRIPEQAESDEVGIGSDLDVYAIEPHTGIPRAT